MIRLGALSGFVDYEELDDVARTVVKNRFENHLSRIYKVDDDSITSFNFLGTETINFIKPSK